ncbi:glycosyltransferase [Mariniblastus sp.]|nr:glycosyltransferase [Mariniblastus sp.]
MSQRILFTVEHLYPLGPAQLLFPLASGLVAAGKDIVVAVLGQRTDDVDPWLAAGIRVFFVNGDDQTPLHTHRDAFTVIRELRNLIRLVEPDTLHAWCGEAIWLTLLAIQRIPLTAELPNLRLMATEQNLHPEKKFVRSLLEDWLSPQIETLIVPHEAVANDLADEGLIATYTEIIPNGVSVGDLSSPAEKIAIIDRAALSRGDLRNSIREKMSLPENSRLAITVADLEPRTRLKDLVWATDLLSCVREDFHFAIIGTGDQLWRLRKFARQTEARDHVHFLGLPPSPESYLAAADFYWQSHLQSPLSGPLLAAMAMGLPTISVLGPGTEAIIDHQATGFATNFGARDEFARWTKYLIEQAEPASRLARQGQDHVVNNFAIDPMLQGYLELYALE